MRRARNNNEATGETCKHKTAPSVGYAILYKSQDAQSSLQGTRYHEWEFKEKQMERLRFEKTNSLVDPLGSTPSLFYYALVPGLLRQSV